MSRFLKPTYFLFHLPIRSELLFFCILVFFPKKFMFRPLVVLFSVLDPLLGVIAYGAETTHLDAIGYGVELYRGNVEQGCRGR